MRERFSDPRLSALNTERAFQDEKMQSALVDMLEPDEAAVAAYSVSAHIWFEAVLTDRALLLVKGALRVRTVRMPDPPPVARTPTASRDGVRLKTPYGVKTLWGSKNDPRSRALTAWVTGHTEDPRHDDGPVVPSSAAPGFSGGVPSNDAVFPSKRAARRAAGRRPRKPRPRRVSRSWVGFEPASTVWEMADRCIKCGRPLTDPRSRRARVGTRCIKLWGTQQRKVLNPAHEQWRARKAAADADHAAERARADVDFNRQHASWLLAVEEWRTVRESWAKPTRS